MTIPINQITLDDYRHPKRRTPTTPRPGQPVNITSKNDLKIGAKKELELSLIAQLRIVGITHFRHDQTWHSTRFFRSDLIFDEQRLLVEIEGGVWTNGQDYYDEESQTWKKHKSRHATGTGFHGDCIKYNEAMMEGWSLLRFDSSMIHDGSARATIERWLNLWQIDFDAATQGITTGLTRIGVKRPARIIDMTARQRS